MRRPLRCQKRPQRAVLGPAGRLTIAPQLADRQRTSDCEEAVFVVGVRVADDHDVDTSHAEGRERRQHRAGADAAVVANLAAGVDQHRRAVVKAQQCGVTVADIEHIDVDGARSGAGWPKAIAQQQRCRRDAGAAAPTDARAIGQQAEPSGGHRDASDEADRARRCPDRQPSRRQCRCVRKRPAREGQHRINELQHCDIDAGGQHRRQQRDHRQRQQRQRDERHDKQVAQWSRQRQCAEVP
jgi:hypothetical protein